MAGDLFLSMPIWWLLWQGATWLGLAGGAWPQITVWRTLTAALSYEKRPALHIALKFVSLFAKKMPHIPKAL